MQSQSRIKTLQWRNKKNTDRRNSFLFSLNHTKNRHMISRNKNILYINDVFAVELLQYVFPPQGWESRPELAEPRAAPPASLTDCSGCRNCSLHPPLCGGCPDKPRLQSVHSTLDSERKGWPVQRDLQYFHIGSAFALKWRTDMLSVNYSLCIART